MNLLPEHKAVRILQYTLGITFLWFGILKLFNASPVLNIIKLAIPPFLSDSQIFFFLLSLLEIAIGTAFLANRFVKIAAIVMIIHLLIASSSVLITQGFDPRFPVLSLEGEFVVKNLVLMAAGLVLIAHPSYAKRTEAKKEE